MAWKVECDCEERTKIIIDSLKLFQELLTFFDGQVQNKLFIEEVPNQPYYIWKVDNKEKAWYATKWCRCKACGCFWELNYPDFPANGFVRKFPDSINKERRF